MIVVLAVVIGGLYAAGVFLMLQRQLARLILGLALLTNATNLLVFTVGGLERGRPPLVEEGAVALVPPFADPIPQALVLTAIVIGFGVLAFAMVLGFRAYRSIGTDDLDRLRSTDVIELEDDQRVEGG